MNKHPFLTFVLSGFIAFVLLGGAFATILGLQQNQDTTTRAYVGTPIREDGSKRAVFCGLRCRVDSECGVGGMCFISEKKACPAGKKCTDQVAFGTCRAAACAGDARCSCAPVIVRPTPPMTLMPSPRVAPIRAY